MLSTALPGGVDTQIRENDRVKVSSQAVRLAQFKTNIALITYTL